MTSSPSATTRPRWLLPPTHGYAQHFRNGRPVRHGGGHAWSCPRPASGRLREAVPFILTGLRLGIGHALVGVVVGELVAAQHGIAQRMSVAGTTFQVPTMFAALIVISGTGVLLTMILQRIESRFDAWRPDHR